MIEGQKIKTVEENGNKVNEPTATPQDKVQVDNKEEANDAIPTVEDVLASKRQEIDFMASEEDKVSHVVPFSKVIAEGRAQGNTVFICGQWVVDGEATILAGDTNACKSTVAYNIGNAISKGAKFLGVPSLKSEVVYAETEMSSRQLYNRFKNVKINENFKFLNAVGKTIDWVLDNVESYCKGRKANRKLVVIMIVLVWLLNLQLLLRWLAMR